MSLYSIVLQKAIGHDAMAKMLRSLLLYVKQKNVFRARESQNAKGTHIESFLSAEHTFSSVVYGIIIVIFVIIVGAIVIGMIDEWL